MPPFCKMRALGNLHSQGAVLEQAKGRSFKPSITFPTSKRSWKSLLDVTHHEEYVGPLACYLIIESANIQSILGILLTVTDFVTLSKHRSAECGSKSIERAPYLCASTGQVMIQRSCYVPTFLIIVKLTKNYTQKAIWVRWDLQLKAPESRRSKL